LEASVASRLLAVGAVLVIAGGAALGYGLTRRPPAPTEMTAEQSAAMGAAIATLDASLKEAHNIARTRASTISATRYLVPAIRAGDPETARDMVSSDKGGELRFELGPGEVIEIGKLTDTGFEVLVSQPENAPPSGHGGTASSAAVLDGTRAIVYEVAEVKDGDAAIGYVTVVQPRDLAPVFEQLIDAGIVGRFELGDAQVAIGGSLPEDARTTTKELGEPTARLVVAAPRPGAGRPIAILGAGAGALGLGLVALVIALVAGRRERATPVAFAATQLSLSPDATRLSVAPMAAGTPSPVDAAGESRSSINPHAIGPGAMIGRWEVLRRLGSGGMADVYLAHSKGEAGFEKVVAIKVMHAHLARNERAVAHFLDEARVAARIHHPNVVQILDLGKIGEDYVIVMEYVEGVDLERLLASARAAERPVPIEVGLTILCRICDGLHAAHTAIGADGRPLEIIHRDVKSANVLVSRQGIVKVVDFGIAKAATQAHLTLAGETKGTPSMMAPEQRVGEQVDVRADVYSVAAVGYEIVTGHAVNLDLAALAHLGMENWPHLPPPSSLREALPDELDRILLGAMAFEREARPADCHALEAMLEAVIKQHGLAASDKDVARWVESELRHLVPAFEGATTPLSRPSGIA
jgi:hypothetical protein